jgi:serine/threonine protein kinase
MVEQSSSQIDRYVLKKKLGSGQFGTGFRAYDPEKQQDVCVKLFKNKGALTDKSFKIESEAGAKGLDHPNVI